MSPIEQVGRANRIIKNVARRGAKRFKKVTARWVRRRWRKLIEAEHFDENLPKYRGWVA
jgi:hypothetical protein